MATFKVLLDKRRKRKDNHYPLVIRVYTGDIFRNVNLKTPLREDEFDEKTQRAVKHPNKREINQKISQTLIQLQDTALKFELTDEQSTAQKIKIGVTKPVVKLDFILYGEKAIRDMQSVGRLGNAAAYNAALCAMKTYTGKSTIQFRDVNYELLTSLENKMITAGLKKNSIAAYNRSIRAIYNKAVNEDLVDIKYYPYRKYKIKSEGTAKRNISKDDIVRIINLDLIPNSPQWHSRNYFLLSFNLRGISFTDMATLKSSDIRDGILTYRRKKTHKLYTIKLTAMAKKIIAYYQNNGDVYILPIVPAHIVPNSERERVYIQQAIKTCNKYLNRIGNAVELTKDMTTYFSRHSWASIAKKMGYSKDLISEALGHSFGNRITEIYLDTFDQNVIDDMNETVCTF